MADSPATVGRGYTIADVRFMQHMNGHHAQAIRMARMAETHGASDRVRPLARKIDISRRDEILFMEEWLRARGQAIPAEEQRLAMMMPGMLTPEELGRLDAARGAEFDRLFLEFMTYHHQGALAMVEELFSDPNAAQDPDLFRFVTTSTPTSGTRSTSCRACSPAQEGANSDDDRSCDDGAAQPGEPGEPGGWPGRRRSP